VLVDKFRYPYATVAADRHFGLSGFGKLRTTSEWPRLDTTKRQSYPFARAFPIVGITHTITPQFFFRWFTTSLLRLLYPFDTLVCTSVAARDAIHRLFSSIPPELRGLKDLPFQTPIIPLGVAVPETPPDTSSTCKRELGLPVQSTVLLYFGRFSFVSKADLTPVIAAFSAVRTSDSYLVLAGDDARYHIADRLWEIARQYGCQDHVRIIPDPNSRQKAVLFRAADVFVSPSDHTQETFGITILEAMAHGLPVIASDWSGYRDTVVEGTTGFLVPTFFGVSAPTYPFLDSPIGVDSQELARHTIVDVKCLKERLALLIHNSHLRAELGHNGLQRVKDLYTWPRVMSQYDRLWTDDIEESRRQELRHDTMLDIAPLTLPDVFQSFPSHRIHMMDTVHLGDDTSLSGLPNEVDINIRQALANGASVMLSQLIEATPHEIQAQCLDRWFKYGVLHLNLDDKDDRTRDTLIAKRTSL
jgi:glycosyltransferase involved in cell wall biosynthesis